MHPPAVDVPSVPTWTAGWSWDPLVLGGLAVSAALYTRGALRMRERSSHVRPWHALAHGGGLVILAIALVSPLDAVSDVLFSAHMAQHELLMLIAAPLIVLGRPLAPVLWALPRRFRVQARRAARKRWLVATWRVLTHPVFALALHGATRWAWHIPSAFDAALADERVHALQHASFFATAMLFWWTLVHGRYGRLGYGVGVAFVFLTLLHSGLLAAMLAFADEPLYAHGERSLRIGVDALVDQQRAGLIMWVPAGIIMMAIGLALFAAWLGHSAQRMAHSPHPSLRGR